MELLADKRHRGFLYRHVIFLIEAETKKKKAKNLPSSVLLLRKNFEILEPLTVTSENVIPKKKL